MEALIGSAIVAVATVGILTAFSSSLQLSNRNTQTVRAGFLLEEGIEAARILRDNGWRKGLGGWPSGASYRLNFTGGTWATTTDISLIDNLFDRIITVTDVYRDGNNDIAVSGALDTNTKKITVSVAWRGRSATTTNTVDAYLTNLFQD